MKMINFKDFKYLKFEYVYESFDFHSNLNRRNESGQEGFFGGSGRGHDEALRRLGRSEADDRVETAPDDERRRSKRLLVELDVAQLYTK